MILKKFSEKVLSSRILHMGQTTRMSRIGLFYHCVYTLSDVRGASKLLVVHCFMNLNMKNFSFISTITISTIHDGKQVLWSSLTCFCVYIRIGWLDLHTIFLKLFLQNEVMLNSTSSWRQPMLSNIADDLQSSARTFHDQIRSLAFSMM